MPKKIFPTYSIQVDELVRLMQKEGFSKEALAKKADINPRTVTRALSGERLRLDVIKNMAKALNVETTMLIPQKDQPSNANRSTIGKHEDSLGFGLTFKVQIPYESFGQLSTLEGWLNQLAEIVYLVGEIEVELAGPKEVQLHCKLTHEADVRALARSFADGSLQPLAIDTIQFDSTNLDVTKDVAQVIAARSKQGTYSGAAEIEKRIQMRQQSSLFSTILKLVLDSLASNIADSYSHSVQFDDVAGRPFFVDYHVTREMITELRAPLPPQELADAQVRIAAWANPE